MADPERTCIVTGGAGGIGAAIAHGLAGQGAAVGICDIDEQAAELVVADITQRGGLACSVRADVRDAQSLESAFDTVESRLGPVGVLFNNAGIPAAAPLEAITLDSFQHVMAVNAFSVIAGTHAFARRARARGAGGKVVNTCSISGKRGVPGGSLYAASKFAVRALTQSYAMELAGDGITVNALCPGMVDTKLWDVIAADFDRRGIDYTGRLVERRNSDIALGRHAQPDDVVGLALFLAGPGSDYITGQCINVDGGMIYD